MKRISLAFFMLLLSTDAVSQTSKGSSNFIYSPPHMVEEGADIELDINWRLWTLMGEPIQDAVIKWKYKGESINNDIGSIMFTFKPYGSKGELISRLVPPEVASKASLIHADFIAHIDEQIRFLDKRPTSKFEYPYPDNYKPYWIAFDPGALMGRNKSSFNIPSSPNWGETILSYKGITSKIKELYDTKERNFTTAKMAKIIYKRNIVDQKMALSSDISLRNWFLGSVRWDLSGIRWWYYQQQKKEIKSKKMIRKKKVLSKAINKTFETIENAYPDELSRLRESVQKLAAYPLGKEIEKLQGVYENLASGKLIKKFERKVEFLNEYRSEFIPKLKRVVDRNLKEVDDELSRLSSEEGRYRKVFEREKLENKSFLKKKKIEVGKRNNVAESGLNLLAKRGHDDHWLILDSEGAVQVEFGDDVCNVEPITESKIFKLSKWAGECYHRWQDKAWFSWRGREKCKVVGTIDQTGSFINRSVSERELECIF